MENLLSRIEFLLQNLSQSELDKQDCLIEILKAIKAEN